MTSFSEAGRIKCKYSFLRGGGRVNDPPLHFYGVGVGAFDDPLGEFDLDGQISPYPDPVDGMSGDTIPYKMNTTAERGSGGRIFENWAILRLEIIASKYYIIYCKMGNMGL